MARMVAEPPVVEARCNASFRRCLIAPTMRLRTAPASRNRTSAFAGWTFTSTSAETHSTNKAATACRSGEEVEIGAPERAGERLVAHRAPIDEQELLRGVRPAIGRQARSTKSRKPSRRASSATELALKSSPSAWRSRSAKPSSPAPAAGQSKGDPISVPKENRTSGAAIASRLTVSAAAKASARSDLRNLSLAGVAANRSRASTRAPVAQAQGSIAALIPSSTRSLRPCGEPALRVRISSRDTEAIEAAPRRGSQKS